MYNQYIPTPRYEELHNGQNGCPGEAAEAVCPPGMPPRPPQSGMPPHPPQSGMPPCPPQPGMPPHPPQSCPPQQPPPPGPPGPPHQPPRPPQPGPGGGQPPPPPHPQAASAFGSLSQALGSRLGTLKFDAETLIALAAIWFLVSDSGEPDSELLLMIGILLVLGL